MSAAVLVFSAEPSLQAQILGRQTGCYAASIKANPNRPTVGSPADITQYGVLELEFGWDRTWFGGATREQDFGSLLKFGLLCDVELRWNSTNFLLQSDASGSESGFGDNWLGPQIRLYRQTAHVPTLAVSYAAKIPSAGEATGLGSGRVDHAFTFLASKDIKGFHFDFNTVWYLIGTGTGFDRNELLTLSFSHPLHGGLGFDGEFHGNTRLNPGTPGFVASLWALTYQISPRLVVDGGIDVGLTSAAPNKRVFAGVTYSIANLYLAMKQNHSARQTSK